MSLSSSLCSGVVQVAFSPAESWDPGTTHSELFWTYSVYAVLGIVGTGLLIVMFSKLIVQQLDNYKEISVLVSSDQSLQARDYSTASYPQKRNSNGLDGTSRMIVQSTQNRKTNCSDDKEHTLAMWFSELDYFTANGITNFIATPYVTATRTTGPIRIGICNIIIIAIV